MKALYLLFNHKITNEQKTEAVRSLKVQKIIEGPNEIHELWSQIPADISSLIGYLQPIQYWLTKEARPGDYVLIQGDFGACYIMVQFAFQRGLIPIYSTTKRRVEEEVLENGSVKLVHHFEHQMFRKYEEIK